MSTVKAKKGRKPVLIVHPDQLKTEAQQEAFVDKAVDVMIDAINENLRSKGKPPLK